MNHLTPLFLSILIVTASCSSNTRSSNGQAGHYEAISARGDTLFARIANRRTQNQREKNLQKAKRKFQSHPNSVDALITYGQHSATLDHYFKAIEIYTQGLGKHPNNARLYQLRGRQYIITRHFDNAVFDLKKASKLADKDQSNRMVDSAIWYNLGLAKYLKGNFKKAATSLRHSLNSTHNNNMRQKVSYWLYMSLRRAGMDLQAGKVLDPVNTDMNLTRNEPYQKLLLVFKGDFEVKSLITNVNDATEDIIISYGLGNWHYINNRKKRARELFQAVYTRDNWSAISYIAAETDLARLDF